MPEATAIALSIHRRYMDLMIRGDKVVELRKNRPTKLLGELAVGRTVVAYLIPTGSQCVEAVAVFIRFSRVTDSTDIDSLSSMAAVPPEAIRGYFAGRDGYAWELGRPAIPMAAPIPLRLTGIHGVPQSWKYIDQQSELCISLANNANKKAKETRK